VGGWAGVCVCGCVCMCEVGVEGRVSSPDTITHTIVIHTTAKQPNV
jgi:hypothetical protein